MHTDSELAGTVKFMFQPAEEGMGGAEKMIEDGVLENPKVDVALGLACLERETRWLDWHSQWSCHGRSRNLQDENHR